MVSYSAGDHIRVEVMACKKLENPSKEYHYEEVCLQGTTLGQFENGTCNFEKVKFKDTSYNNNVSLKIKPKGQQIQARFAVLKIEVGE